MLTTLNLISQLVDAQSSIDCDDPARARDALTKILTELGDTHTTYVLVSELYTGEHLNAEQPDRLQEVEFADLDNATQVLGELYECDLAYSRTHLQEQPDAELSSNRTEYQTEIVLDDPDDCGYCYVRYIVRREIQYKLLPQRHDTELFNNEEDPIHVD